MRNPNKSKGIEKRWKAEIARRFKALDAAMRLIPISSNVTNVTDLERLDIDRFIAEFERLAIAAILNSPWQNPYQTEAYLRGVERANKSLKRAVKNPSSEFFALTHAERLVSMELPQNRNELDRLHGRANKALQKWVDQLLEDTKNIMYESMGVVPVDDIHEAISDRINVTVTYARRIAATEIAQASQTSVIKQTQELQQRTDEELGVIWITVDDDRVRDLHTQWHGKVMTTEQAARNITISPFGCRCGLVAISVDNVSKKLIDRLTKERQEMLKAA